MIFYLYLQCEQVQLVISLKIQVSYEYLMDIYGFPNWVRSIRNPWISIGLWIGFGFRVVWVGLDLDWPFLNGYPSIENTGFRRVMGTYEVASSPSGSV